MEEIIKTVKLNFKPNEKSPNGRIYNQESFFKKLDERIKNGTLLFEDSDKYTRTEVDIKKIVGFVDNYFVKDDELFFNIIPTEEDNIMKCIDECTISIIGEKEESGETKLKNIICLRPSPEYIFKSEEEIIKELEEELDNE